ncbi:MAG: hypothetical protein RL143_1147 [Pseudomonadota bacterium]
MLRISLLILALFMVGCSSLGTQLTQQKMAEIQLPLTTLDDGVTFTWGIDPTTRGEVKLVRTFAKSGQVCRLVEEQEMINGKQGKAVSTYCMHNGEWK